MKKLALLILLAALAACETPEQIANNAANGSRYVSWQGEWRLNEDESRIPPGFRGLSNEDIDVVRDDGKVLQYIDSGVLPDGTYNTYTFNGTWDGVERSGSNGAGASVRHLGARNFIFHRYFPPELTHTIERRPPEEICTFSADAMKLTCEARTEPTRFGVFREIYDKVG